MFCFKIVTLLGALLISVKSHDSILSDSNGTVREIKTTTRALEAHLAPDFGVSGTFSIVAIDPETGECGSWGSLTFMDEPRITIQLTPMEPAFIGGNERTILRVPGKSRALEHNDQTHKITGIYEREFSGTTIPFSMNQVRCLGFQIRNPYCTTSKR